MSVRVIICLALAGTLVCCGRKKPQHTFFHEVLLPMTPVKDQGETEICWAYAMLATIETEHIVRGDSINLSAVYVARMLDNYKVHHSKITPHTSQRAMCQTLLNIIQHYGIVGYDVLPDGAPDSLPTPAWVFMGGVRYTPLEFAHSVCAPDEYLALTSQPDSPYYKKVLVDVPDNWEGNRMLNVPLDTLRLHVDRALRHRHPVCWESKGHAMTIIGMARDEKKRPYYILKNSWGRRGSHKGLVYMHARKLWRDMLAVYMTRDAYNH